MFSLNVKSNYKKSIVVIEKKHELPKLSGINLGLAIPGEELKHTYLSPEESLHLVFRVCCPKRIV